jgi:hypothetical protein
MAVNIPGRKVFRNEDFVMRCESRAAVINSLMTVYTYDLVT